jgi:hypothetical protein
MWTVRSPGLQCPEVVVNGFPGGCGCVGLVVDDSVMEALGS